MKDNNEKKIKELRRKIRKTKDEMMQMQIMHSMDKEKMAYYAAMINRLDREVAYLIMQSNKSLFIPNVKRFY